MLSTKQFLTTFLLFPPQSNMLHHANHSKIQHNNIGSSKDAAVLIPIFEKNEPLSIQSNGTNNTLINSMFTQHKAPELHVLFTLRASHLRHHPGQVCFPGGKVEPNDKTVIDTAKREAFEEIGLHCEQKHVLGKLPNHQTLTGFNIFPMVALVQQPKNLVIDTNEVSKVFSIPLSFLLDLNNYNSIQTTVNKKPHTMHCITYQEYKIWGATANIIRCMATQFSQ